MYKDRERANEAARERMRRYRERQKGVTSTGRNIQGVTLGRDIEEAIKRISDTPEEERVSPLGDSDYVPSGLSEPCAECGKDLPQLERPRQMQGKCLACVTKDVA